MTEEEKKAAEEAAAEEARLKKEAEAETDPLQPDYKAIAETEKKRADEAERVLAEKRFKESEERRKRKEAGEVDDEDKPLTARQLDERLSRERLETQKTFNEEKALKLAREMTSNEDEAQAAFIHWKTSVIPTNDLKRDVSFAVGGINHSRVVAQNAELTRALRARDGVSDDASGTYRDPPAGSEPKLDALTKASYQRAGFEYDTKLKLFKKKLPKGNFVVKDPVTKQVRPL